MASGERIELVILDIGGVLVRLVEGWADACAKAGVTSIGRMADPVCRGIATDINFAYERGELDHQAYFQRTADVVGLSARDIRRIIEVWLQGRFPQTLELIDELADRVDVACLSNTNPMHWGMMSAPGPNALPFRKMRWRFASHLVGVMKPDPKIYQHVERVTGVAPERIAFFDDAAPNVAAAVDRGWRAWVIEPDPSPADQIRARLAGMELQPGPKAG